MVNACRARSRYDAVRKWSKSWFLGHISVKIPGQLSVKINSDMLLCGVGTEAPRIVDKSDFDQCITFVVG
jgi:hypothetical protein